MIVGKGDEAYRYDCDTPGCGCSFERLLNSTSETQIVCPRCKNFLKTDSYTKTRKLVNPFATSWMGAKIVKDTGGK